MNNKNDITLERLTMAFDARLAKSSAEFDARLAKSAAEFDRKIELSRKESKKSNEDFERRLELSRKESNEDFERRSRESKEEYDRRSRESDEKFERRLELSRKESNEDFERKIELSRKESKESKEEYERRAKESDEKFMRELNQFLKKSGEAFDKRHAELDVKLKRLTEQVTGVSNSNGLFAEDYFLNSFEVDHLNFFGERFDKVIRGKGHIMEDEYDFVLINGKTACIVEVKYKVRKEDIQKTLKKVDSFRINFPEYKNHKIYLGISALTFHKELQRECTKQGIAVIKQKGDKLIFFDNHLKVF